MPLGTAAIIGLSLASAGAQAGSSIYQAHRAGSTNDKAIKAQSDEAARAAALERESQAADRELAQQQMAAQERRYQAALQADRDRWNAYAQIHAPMWQFGQSLLGPLSQMAAGRGGGVPGVPAGGYTFTPMPEVSTARPMVAMPQPAGPRAVGPLAAMMNGGR